MLFIIFCGFTSLPLNTALLSAYDVMWKCYLRLWKKHSVFLFSLFFTDFSAVLLHSEMSGGPSCSSRYDNEHLGGFAGTAPHPVLLRSLWSPGQLPPEPIIWEQRHFPLFILVFMYASGRSHHHPVGQLYPSHISKCSQWLSFNVQINQNHSLNSTAVE